MVLPLSVSVEYSSEDLLQQVISSGRGGEDGKDREERGVVDGDREKLLKYFLKVIGLFEQASCHLAVLKVAETAVMCFDRHDLRSVSSYSFQQS